jgi:DNA-directed RNA polymerase specialized sigma24 family protein
MCAQTAYAHPNLLEEIPAHLGPQIMPSTADPGLLELEELRKMCAGETEHFFRHLEYDARYCYEIFRRAIVDHDQQAWECVYSQYQPLVRSWIHRHNLSRILNEETQFLVNRAFERMWAGVTPQKFANFPDLKSILRYLQMCVNTVLVDTARSRTQASLVDEDISSLPVPSSTNRRSMEDTVLRKTQAERLWSLLDERCKDSKERCILMGMLVNALKARELYVEYPHLFQDVQEVYRVKENLMARLQRDEELAAYLERV